MRAIVTGALQATQQELDMLRELGIEVKLHQDERQPVEDPERYEIAICNGLFVYQDISRFTALKYIQLTSAGFDRVPMDYVTQHGIEIYNAAGVYSVPMAEWTLMRILELYKNAGKMYSNQAESLWEKDRSWRELADKTACIIGFGAYGMETAKRLKAFGVKVTVVNRSQKESPWVDEFYPMEKLDEALSQSDVVILAIALTEQTRKIMNSARFEGMKDGAIFINAARGGLVDESALMRALEAGKISGVALDVFEEEPLPRDNPLWQQERILVTPHNSFVGENNHTRLFGMVIKNLKKYL